MAVRTGEILFVKCVKNGIPNRDPLRDSDARRLFGVDDGRISLSDVSIKRDVRDYVLARFPNGGDDKKRPRNFVFVRKEFSADGKTLLGRDGLAKAMLEQAVAKSVEAGEKGAGAGGSPAEAAPPKEKEKRDERTLMMAAAFDIRVFGAVFSVSKKSFSQTGPVQFAWAHSLHPVETKYTQGTVCMPSIDKPTAEEEAGGAKGKTQGTIWTQYQLPFAVFAMPGIVNATIAKQTAMTDTDMDLILAGLWKGTLHRQARGRGIQQPLLLLHVEYTDPFFRIGFLEEGLVLNPGRDPDGRECWKGASPGKLPPTNVSDVKLDLSRLAGQLEQHKSQIARIRMWHDPHLILTGTLPAEVEVGTWSEGV